MKLHRLLLLGCLLLFLAGSNVQSADPQGWGNIKGQVVWGGKTLPEREPIKVTQDQKHCLMNGPLLEEKYVVDPKTKGVRWVMVFLADAKEPDPKNAKKWKFPVKPGLMKLKNTPVIFDQPCCAFEPHVFGVIEGQTVIVKNSAPVPHNVKIEGGNANPNLNQLLPPGAKLEIPGWTTTGVGAIPINCSIHPWMNAKARVFKHPYFAVTNEKGEFEIKDAPAGKFHLIGWHETGWVTDRTGKPIEVKAKETLDLGKIKMQPPKE
jgi:plastocyanin